MLKYTVEPSKHGQCNPLRLKFLYESWWFILFSFPSRNTNVFIVSTCLKAFILLKFTSKLSRILIFSNTAQISRFSVSPIRLLIFKLSTSVALFLFGTAGQNITLSLIAQNILLISSFIFCSSDYIGLLLLTQLLSDVLVTFSFHNSTNTNSDVSQFTGHPSAMINVCWTAFFYPNIP